MEYIIKKYNPSDLVRLELRKVDTVIRNRGGICKTRINGITTNTFLAALGVINPRPYKSEDVKEIIEHLTEKHIGAIISAEAPVSERACQQYQAADIRVAHSESLHPQNLTMLFNMLIDTCINRNKPVLFTCKSGTKTSPYILAAFCMYMLYNTDAPKFWPITLSLNTFFITETLSYIVGIKSDTVMNADLLEGLLLWEYDMKVRKISVQVAQLVADGRIDLENNYTMVTLSRDVLDKLSGPKPMITAPEKKFKSPDISILKDIIRPRQAVSVYDDDDL